MGCSLIFGMVKPDENVFDGFWCPVNRQLYFAPCGSSFCSRLLLASCFHHTVQLLGFIGHIQPEGGPQANSIRPAKSQNAPVDDLFS